MIPMLIFAIADTTPPPPPLADGRGNVVSLFSYDDYPDGALQNDWQGTVVVDLRIDAGGRPRSCQIFRSSGHEALDLKTCEVMLIRARFLPARDSAGHPVEDIFRTPPVTWRIIEDPAPQPEPVAQ